MAASMSILSGALVIFQALWGGMPSSSGGLEQAWNDSFWVSGMTCQKPQWLKRPQPKSGSIYLASMSAECLVYPELGGDFEKLRAFSIEQLRSRSTIERGPVDVTFEGLPSKYLDVTVKISGKNATTIRQDVNLATDQHTKFVSSSLSRRIDGTGYGAYLKKVDTRVDVTKTEVKTEDRVVVTFYSEVEKPWYAPEGVFLSEIESRVPGEFAKLRDQVVGEMAKNY
ncbi:MAG: hypothetical protein RJB38_1242 [Pseudomonadota bacterium]|jgi:hypothetical protein